MGVCYESQRAPVTVLGFLPHVWTVSQASESLSTSPCETTGPLILVTYTWCITLWKAGIRVNKLIHPGIALSLPWEQTRLLFTVLANFSFCPGTLWEKCWLSTGWTPASSRNSCCKWHLWFTLTAPFEVVTSKGLPITPGWCVCLFSSHTVTFCLWFLSGNISCFAVSYHQPSYLISSLALGKATRDIVQFVVHSISSTTTLLPAMFALSLSSFYVLNGTQCWSSCSCSCCSYIQTGSQSLILGTEYALSCFVFP